jgi:predicted metalloendopeptidase
MYSGRLYDADGNKQDWWSNSSSTAFVEKTECIVDQYNEFLVIGANV